MVKSDCENFPGIELPGAGKSCLWYGSCKRKAELIDPEVLKTVVALEKR